MEYFVGKNASSLDALTSVETLMKADPEYYGPRLDAIAELRQLDDGTLHKGNEFRRVASLCNVPMFSVARLLDPEWMSDKKRFYAWLKRHPEYKTYDTRGADHPTETFFDGKPILGGA